MTEAAKKDLASPADALLVLLLLVGCSSTSSTRFVETDGGLADTDAPVDGASGTSAGGFGGGWPDATSGGAGGSGGLTGGDGGATGGSGGATTDAAGGGGAGGGGATCAAPAASIGSPESSYCVDQQTQHARIFIVHAGSCTIAWQPAAVSGGSASIAYSASCSAPVDRRYGCGATVMAGCQLAASGDGVAIVTSSSAAAATTWSFTGCDDGDWPPSQDDAGKLIAPDLDHAIAAVAKAACIF